MSKPSKSFKQKGSDLKKTYKKVTELVAGLGDLADNRDYRQEKENPLVQKQEDRRVFGNSIIGQRRTRYSVFGILIIMLLRFLWLSVISPQQNSFRNHLQATIKIDAWFGSTNEKSLSPIYRIQDRKQLPVRLEYRHHSK